VHRWHRPTEVRVLVAYEVVDGIPQYRQFDISGDAPVAGDVLSMPTASGDGGDVSGLYFSADSASFAFTQKLKSDGVMDLYINSLIDSSGGPKKLSKLFTGRSVSLVAFQP
jgi:hypothetical protein